MTVWINRRTGVIASEAFLRRARARPASSLSDPNGSTRTDLDGGARGVAGAAEGSGLVKLEQAIDLYVVELARLGRSSRTRDDYWRKLIGMCSAPRLRNT
jgi:hypothetical protein